MNPAVVLRGITWQHPRGYDPLVAASDAWMARHPDVRVEWHQLPWYRFEEEVLRSLADRDGAYDLVMFDHPWVGRLAAGECLIAWDELVPPEYLASLRARVVAPSLESYEWEGRLWALPLDAACHASLYRCDLVDAATLPVHWDDIAKWASRYHRPPARYGLLLSLEGVLGHCLFCSMLAGLGHPPYVDEDGPHCDRAAATHVLETLRSLIALTPPGSTRWGPWDIYEHLLRNDDVGYSPSLFPYVNYFGRDGRSAHLRLHRVPSFGKRGPGAAILGGVGLGIARTCRHPTAARDLGIHLMSDEIQRDVFPRHSGQPATRAAWEDAALNAAKHGFYRSLADNMKIAYIRPRYPAFHQLELENGRVLQRFWDAELSLAQALDKLRAI